MARTSQSLLLHPDFASEIYGYLDRVHVGGSLTANRGLNGLLFALRHRLPAHHLTCKFEKDPEDGVYWMVLRHFRRDLCYNDMRRFKVPSEAGPSADCAVILHHLSNSHVRSFKTMGSNSRFAVKMLAAVADRNVSVGALRLRPDEGRLTDYRSMDTVFDGAMRLASLELHILEHEFATIVKTTDFFRMATVGRLKTLKLQLEEPWLTSQEPRRWAVVNSPLWIDGIHLLRNAERFEVEYESDRLLQPICLKLVQLCEKFERGEVSELVQHFKFVTCHKVAFPFNEDNKTASAIKVGKYEWDVYRFRNASAGDWLTACVGREFTHYWRYCVLHIVRGDAHPDASFAARYKYSQ
ncbi:hypothetical protein AAVH_13348 [Aphelenchoides avenae]|nr:hypothetical protein AAVH_13348 [Aphelenchus avenae]